jgi:hypothetical protein
MKTKCHYPRIKIFLGTVLILFAICLIIAAILFFKGIFSILILVIAADLICTVFWKPLIKAGPIVKFLHKDLKD